ncbi:MAG: exodeoxyribonuclease V subunit alpha [Actinomycetia bacterium]|nr:exodeoxyribonuclease V subunit alpha [Actinomycetes bacterium]
MTTAPVSSIATGLLRDFSEAGVLTVADVQVARRVGHLFDPAAPESVLLAFALTVRALRMGAVALDSTQIPQLVEASLEEPPPQPLPWPEPTAWAASLRSSPLVTVGASEPGRRPLRLVDDLLYLERHWAEQELVRRELLRRSRRRPQVADPDGLAQWAAEVSARDRLGPGEVNRQAEAAQKAVESSVLVLAGGPGTGKTTTVARALALVARELGRAPTVALAAPSGRAAARLEEAVHQALTQIDVISPEIRRELQATRATTVHRLLGYRGRSYSRTAADPLPHEVVVVDELSMVSLSLMANLLPAVRDDARLILVGDPEQLAPVDAGAVLADITAALEEAAKPPLPLVRLRHTWRYSGEIQQLADLVRSGEAESALELLRHGCEVTLVPLDDSGNPGDLTEVAQVAQQVGAAADAAARAGQVRQALQALSQHRVLCAHRHGRYGASTWARMVEQWVGQVVDEHRGEWYLGRPLLVTKNDVDLGIANGDAGIIVATESGPRAAFERGPEPLLLPPAQLVDVETMHAITIHKAQGSQFEEVTVVLPPLPSPLLTRELLYTAVTRATTRVRVVAHPEAFAAAVATRALRASGLRSRLLAAS